jgi:hypothetical protein
LQVALPFISVVSGWPVQRLREAHVLNVSVAGMPPDQDVDEYPTSGWSVPLIMKMGMGREGLQSVGGM